MSRRPRSIAARLVVLFTASAALLLCAGLGLVYWIVVQHAYEEDNEVLDDKTLALRADLAGGRGPELLREELKIRRAGERVTYFVRILDSGQNVIAETPGMRELLPMEDFPAPDAPIVTIHARGRLLACVAAQEMVDGQNYTLHIAQDRSSDERFTRRFGFILAGVIVLGVIASALIAIRVTSRGLQPLAEMTRSLERVGPTRLDERVPPEGWPRELRPLVVAFDEMLDRLEESFTRLSQFSADLAHELRTPITNLRGEAEVALRRERSPGEYREVIESSLAECQRLSRMIDTLLFLARAEAADRTVERTAFDGAAAIGRIADYYGTIGEDRRIRIEARGEGEISADTGLFERAVGNLVDNALRHTPDGGRIEIALTHRDQVAEVTVTDNGNGIAPEHLPRVFDRFYQADPSRTSSGAGLGLALVKSIAEMHGGTARVASEPGKGTAVTLTFPQPRAS